ncbi:hypothetical protein Aab01nite_45440 [Paractinoplanes abujensis]|nr:hypothetical protein Aab01nite_45440 [Actinoplanes abujensis]
MPAPRQAPSPGRSETPDKAQPDAGRVYGGAAQPAARAAATPTSTPASPGTRPGTYGKPTSGGAPATYGTPSTYGSAAPPSTTPGHPAASTYGSAAPSSTTPGQQTPSAYGSAAPPSTTPGHPAASTYGSAAPPSTASGQPAPASGSGKAGAPTYGRTPATSGTYGSPSPSGPAPAPATYGSASPAPRRRRGRLVALLVAFALLVVLLGGGATVQLNRELPAATLATSVAGTMKIPGAAPQLPWPDSGTAEIMIEGLGRLGGSGRDTAAPIGSVAKVMTAYVILKNHPLQGDEEGPSLTVTAADVADYRARIASNQSLVTVRVGQKLTERDAIEALMLPSANNIAHQLAVWDAGSEAAFVDKMNAAADELGMTDTEYTDPSGYLPTTVSTAADQVKLGRAALKMEVFAEIVALDSARIPVTGKIRNYNDLLGVEGVFGIKTGSTDEAGGNLLFSAYLTVGGRKLTIVGAVFNQPGLHTPEQLANVNREVKALLKAVRQTVKQYPLLPADPVGEVRTAWGATSTIRPAKPLQVVGWPGMSVPVKVSTTAPGATVTAGQPVGSVQASGVRVDLTADAATADPSLWWRLSRTS